MARARAREGMTSFHCSRGEYPSNFRLGHPLMTVQITEKTTPLATRA
jgi:hypothetical protein